MPTIDMSAGFSATLAARMLGIGETPYDNGGNVNGGVVTLSLYGPLIGSTTSPQSGGYGRSRIGLYRGAVPTDFSTLGAVSSRDADLIVAFYAEYTDYSPSQTNINPAIVSTVYRAVGSTATLTWFRIVSYGIGNNIYHQIVGTIGTNGSGADLEMQDINVVAGSLYRVLNLRIQFPTSF